MVKLELTNCTNFQSGTALNIRKYCPNLRYLRLDIDSAEANSNAGLGEVLAEQNIHTLENQVSVKNYNHSPFQLSIIAGSLSPGATDPAAGHDAECDGQV